MEPKRGEKGNILVSSLLILVVMNLLGASMVNTSVNESKMSSFKTIESTVFQVTESCTKTAIDWLKGFSSPQPIASFPRAFDSDVIGMDSIMIDNTGVEAKLNAYSFDCVVDYLSMKTVGGSSGTGIGTGIGSGTGYGGGGVVRHFYEIESTGQGPRNSSRRTFTIVSVNY
ncbi:MAG: pilus assembly PilX N-terminal domain-containing protein [Rickettsiales bacterium]|nr:pilus assembly PilX N-terminal domain-containing protein [Rickettsiales bacterium]